MKIRQGLSPNMLNESLIGFGMRTRIEKTEKTKRENVCGRVIIGIAVVFGGEQKRVKSFQIRICFFSPATLLRWWFFHWWESENKKMEMKMKMKMKFEFCVFYYEANEWVRFLFSRLFHPFLAPPTPFKFNYFLT